MSASAVCWVKGLGAMAEAVSALRYHVAEGSTVSVAAILGMQLRSTLAGGSLGKRVVEVLLSIYACQTAGARAAPLSG